MGSVPNLHDSPPVTFLRQFFLLVVAIIAGCAYMELRTPAVLAVSGSCPSIPGGYNVALTPPASSPICVALDPYSFTVGVDGLLRIRTHFIEGEVPGGVPDGQNRVFRLSSVPAPVGSVKVFRNGLRQRVGQDYTVVGAVITFTMNATPAIGDLLTVDYRS